MVPSSHLHCHLRYLSTTAAWSYGTRRDTPACKRSLFQAAAALHSSASRNATLLQSPIPPARVQIVSKIMTCFALCWAVLDRVAAASMCVVAAAAGMPWYSTDRTAELKPILRLLRSYFKKNSMWLRPRGPRAAAAGGSRIAGIAGLKSVKRAASQLHVPSGT